MTEAQIAQAVEDVCARLGIADDDAQAAIAIAIEVVSTHQRGNAALTAQENRLLNAIVSGDGYLFSHAKLVEIMRTEASDEAAAVSVVLAHIRQKLPVTKHLVQNVYGQGYRAAVDGKHYRAALDEVYERFAPRQRAA